MKNIMKKKTTKEFIEDAKRIHGDKYDYSNVKYVNSNTKVCICCKKHGVFTQLPSNHLKGQGCTECKNEALRMAKSKSKEDFIKEATLIHNNKYDYSNVVYINNNTKISILCPKHGEFWQEPRSHLNGCGCSECSKNKKLTKERFSKLGNLIHNNKYDYSKVNYVNANSIVCIICPEHGEFWQTPHNHTHSKKPQGCPLCKTSKMERELRNYFNLKNIVFEEQKKFKWLGRQSLDFYLPKQNVAIECQGIQHFKENEHFDGKNGLYERITLDKLKRNLCKDNNVKLLYYANYDYKFPYEVITDKNKLIDIINNEKDYSRNGY